MVQLIIPYLNTMKNKVLKPSQDLQNIVQPKRLKRQKGNKNPIQTKQGGQPPIQAKQRPIHSKHSPVQRQAVTGTTQEETKGSIQYVDNEKTNKVKKQIMALYKNSQMFKSVYDAVDNLSETWTIEADDKKLQEIYQKATNNQGTGTAEGVTLPKEKKVLFSEVLANEIAIAEEFFHIYQKDFYKDEKAGRKSADWDAEAKLFDLAVYGESLLRKGGESSLSGAEAFLNVMDLYSPHNMDFSTKTMNVEGGIVMLLLDSMGQQKSAGIEGNEALEKEYKAYLEEFIKKHNRANDPYKGANSSLLPKAYDHIIKKH